MTAAWVGLGANVGTPRDTLEEALRRLAAGGDVRVDAVSPWYATAPVGGPPGQPDFVNAVARVATQLGPRALLGRMQAVEVALGRDRAREPRHGPRPVDLDLLLFGDRRVREPGLVVPHPRLEERAFVLVPLADLAPDLVLPGSGRTVRAACRSLDRSGVRPLGGGVPA